MKYKALNYVDLLWELPLSILSYFIHRAIKSGINTLIKKAESSNVSIKTECWKVLDKNILGKKGFLVFILVNAPRWNVHAVNAVLSIKARDNLSIKIPNSHNTKCVYTIVIKDQNEDTMVISSLGVYSEIIYKDYRASGDDHENDYYIISLPRGEYKLGARYYDCGSNMQLPAVAADKDRKIHGQNIENNINEFYKDLIHKDCLLFRVIGFYTHTMLRFRGLLGENVVARSFLPAGNPDTSFMFGHLFPNQSLIAELDSEVFEDFFVYCCIYNRSSLPVAWYEVKKDKFQAKNINKKTFYLFRFCKRSSSAILDNSLLKVYTCY